MDSIVQRRVSSDACRLASVFSLESPPSASANAPSIWQMDSIVQRRVSSNACRLVSAFCLEAPPSASANAPSIWQMDSMIRRRLSSDAVGWHLSLVRKPLPLQVQMLRRFDKWIPSSSVECPAMLVSAPSIWHRIRWADFRHWIRHDTGVCRHLWE
jgi:hypothetical protein